MDILNGMKIFLKLTHNIYRYTYDLYDVNKHLIYKTKYD